MTILDFIAQSLKQAAAYNSHDVVPPRAVLWTDAERIWEPVIEQLRVAYPAIWTLGEYQPEVVLPEIPFTGMVVVVGRLWCRRTVWCQGKPG